MAKQFALNASSIQRHKASHLLNRIAKAVERKELKADDQFMDHIQFLLQKSRQYVQDAHGAVKYQLTTKDVYTEFRDIGAMAPALNAARGIGELYGQATGRLNPQQQPAAGVFISVNIPSAAASITSAQPAIDVQAIEPTTAPAIESGEPDQQDSGE